MTRVRVASLVSSLIVVGLGLLVLTPAADAKGRLQDVEEEFRAAIAKVSPATVICVAQGVEEKRQGSTSGVIVSRDGYVLSNGDVGAAHTLEGRRITGTDYKEDIEVRVPDLERGGFATYSAHVVKRVRGVDTSLLKIDDPPPGGFPEFLAPAKSTHLKVGDFTFTMGNAFGMAKEAPPTLTAGVVASLRPLPAADGGGIEFLYTSAAVNPGVNGGPCVDIEGHLVGTVSTFLGAEPGEPFQFLGKVIPMERIRAAYERVPDAAELFSQPIDDRRRAKASLALETVFRHVAHGSGPSIVSLDVKRSQTLNSSVPARGSDGKLVLRPVQRYLGPVSGVLLDGDGWVLTSLYNLTNTVQLLQANIPGLAAEAELETGWRAIESVTVHFLDGGSAPAQAVAHNGLLGLALLKAKLPEGRTVRPWKLATDDDFATGRFVCALGNPFGATGRSDPFLTVGILAKQHAAGATQAWRGQWQTDAGITDGNCGGALVDLEGRLLGILQIWFPTRHGRNSGIGFVAPAPSLVAALPRLKEGKSLKRGFLGIKAREGSTQAFVATVEKGSPAEAAGLNAGDCIVAVDGRETPTWAALIGQLSRFWEGEYALLTVKRGDDELELQAQLGPRP